MTTAELHEPYPTRAPTGDALVRAIGDLERRGVVVVEGVLDEMHLRMQRQALERAIASDRAARVQLEGFSFDPDPYNLRVFNLVKRDAAFRELLLHPIEMTLVSHLLGKRVLLSNFSANVTRPGSGAMDMHADQRGLPRPWPEWPCGVNIGWALDDFTVENGGTCVVPGSHRYNRAPESDYAGDDVLALVMPAGSMFAIDSRLWHRTGANRSGHQTRAALFAYYVRPFVRTNWDWARHLDPQELRSYPSPLREMLEGDRPY